MSKFNNYISFLLPLILVFIIVYGYLRIKSFDIGKSDPSIAISDNNILFIDSPDFFSLMDELLKEGSIWNELKIIPEIQQTDSFIHSLLSLSNKEEKIKLLLSRKVALALNLNSDNSLSTVLICQQTTRSQSSSLFTLIQKLQGVNNVTRKKLASNYLYEIVPNKNTGIRNLYFSFKKGLFVTSFSEQQIEGLLEYLSNAENNKALSPYAEIRHVVTNSQNTNLYLNFKTLDILLSKGLNNISLNTARFAGSAGFDFNIQRNGISLNGFLVNNDSIKGEIGIIDRQKPAPTELIKAIPASVASFILLNINDFNAFLNTQDNYKLWKKNKIKLDELERIYEISLQDFIKNLIKEEFGLILLEDGRKVSSFFIAEVNSGSIAESQLKEYIQKWASVNKKDPSANYFYKEIDKQSKIKIYRLPLGGIPEMIFGNIFSEVKNDFFTVYDNYLIFGNSASELGDFVYQLILGQNFYEAEKYKEILDNLLSRSNLFVYADPLKISRIFADKFQKQSLDYYNDAEILKKFNAFSFQANYSDDLYYSRVFFNYSDLINEQVNNVWQSKLDTIIITKPAIVINHLNSGKEIIVQDAKNQLYLLSNAGRILWKILIDGPILSEIYQIDYYRNNKFQYLFNTRNKIYIIDRNGNTVDNYPLALRSPATNGLSLFDYDNDGNIRICVACENRHIYMYNREGRVIPGWNPVPTDHILSKPIQHFRISGKDYIIAADSHKTYIYDRQGKIRVNLPKQFPISQNNPFYLDTGDGKTRLVNTDIFGNLIFISLTGNTSIEKKEQLKNTHFFILTDLNGDRKNEFVYVSDSTLTVSNGAGKVLFNHTFSSGINFKPVIFEFAANDKKIGIVDDAAEKIYLINNDGTFYKGFPLKGSSLFSISSFPGSKGRFNLIVGNNDSFLYNYSVL